jgi:4'-phosphopantetheinyl transferase
MTSTPVTSPDVDWPLPPEALALGHDEVHVWRVSLDQASSQIQSFRHKLAADEQARAARFHFERDRDHFTVARGVLRTILGRYLNRAPKSLSFRYGSHGKPDLAGASGRDTIRFNLSHSHGLALYAIGRGRELGIDLERIRRDLAVLEIAERFFSREETARLRAFPGESRYQEFFRCWTGKEAYVKARGGGLSLPLDQFDLSLAPERADAPLVAQRDPSEVSRWSFRELTPARGYLAALAAEGQGWRLSCWQWPDLGSPSV